MEIARLWPVTRRCVASAALAVALGIGLGAANGVSPARAAAPPPASAQPLPPGWERLSPAKLAALDQHLKPTSLAATLAARERLSEHAWSAYLQKPELLNDADSTVRYGWLHLAAQVADSLNSDQQEAIQKSLSDRYLSQPGIVEKLSYPEVTELTRVLDETSHTSEPVIIPIRRWVLGGRQWQSCTPEQVRYLSNLLVSDSSSQDQQALAQLMQWSVDQVLASPASPAKTLGQGHLQSLVSPLRISSSLELRRQLGKKITDAVSDPGVLGQLSPSAMTEVCRSLATLDYSWQEHVRLAAQWITLHPEWSTMQPAALTTILRPVTANETSLTEADLTTQAIVQALDKARATLAAQGAKLTERQHENWGSLLSQWLAVLPPKPRVNLEGDPASLSLLGAAEAIHLHASWSANPRTKPEGDHVLQNWLALPGAMDQMAGYGWADPNNRGQRLGAIQSMIGSLTDAGREALLAALNERVGGDATLASATALDIGRLQALLAALGDHSGARVLQWAQTKPPAWIPVGQFSEAILELRAARSLVRLQTPQQLLQWLPPLREGFERAGSIRPEGAMFLASAFVQIDQGQQWLALLDQKGKDPSITGDAKAGWLLSRAYSQEAVDLAATRDGPPIASTATPAPSESTDTHRGSFGVLCGVSWGKAALRVAQSSSMKLQCRGYLLGRSVSAVQFDEAIGATHPTAQDLKDPVIVAQIQEWNRLLGWAMKHQAQADTYHARIKERRELEGQLASFREQIETAKKRGRPQESIESLERIAAALEAKLGPEDPQPAEPTSRPASPSSGS